MASCATFQLACMSLTNGANTYVRRLPGHIKHRPQHTALVNAYKRQLDDNAPHNKPVSHIQSRFTALHRLWHRSVTRPRRITCCLAPSEEVATSKQLAKYAGRQLPVFLLTLVLLTQTLTARLAVLLCPLHHCCHHCISSAPAFSGVQSRHQTVFCCFWTPYMQVCYAQPAR